MFDLHNVMVETFLDSCKTPPEEIILDYDATDATDATDDPTHGEQDKVYDNGFYRGYCFLPLYVFCGDQMLVSYLRPSSVGAVSSRLRSDETAGGKHSFSMAGRPHHAARGQWLL